MARSVHWARSSPTRSRAIQRSTAVHRMPGSPGASSGLAWITTAGLSCARRAHAPRASSSVVFATSATLATGVCWPQLERRLGGRVVDRARRRKTEAAAPPAQEPDHHPQIVALVRLLARQAAREHCSAPVYWSAISRSGDRYSRAQVVSPGAVLSGSPSRAGRLATRTPTCGSPGIRRGLSVVPSIHTCSVMPSPPRSP